MKTKEEILEMSKTELLNYKWSSELDIKSTGCSDCSNCSDCFGCFDCSNCSNCSGCSDCFGCRNIKVRSRYLICNVQLTKEEYKAKMKEIEGGKNGNNQPTKN